MIALFALLGAPETLDEPRFADPLARHQNSTALYEQIAQLTPARSTAEWLSLFANADMPAMAVRDLDDIFEDPHLVDTDFFRLRQHPTEGEFREMAPPVRYSADPARTLGFAPGLNAQGSEIRSELLSRGSP